MYYNARWYDPSLGRFAQADTIIPEQSQGVQAWDRYAYTNNNPVRYTDLTGHCIHVSCVRKMSQIFQATGFLMIRMLQKGELKLTESDWEAAANFAAPAIASGSKESATWTYGMFATVVTSTTIITTENGDVQVFDESNLVESNSFDGSIPAGAGLPGGSASVTHGLVFGLDDNALNYSGDAVELNVGVPAAVAGGPTVAGYVSPDFAVGGVDWGLYAGVGPTILSTAKTNADPNGNGLVSNFLKEILPEDVDGFGLFACRMVSMCGAY